MPSAFRSRITSTAHSSAREGLTKSEGSAVGSAANFSAIDLNDAPFSSQSASYAPISRRGEIAISAGAASSLRAVNEECCIGALQAKDSLPDSLNAKSRVDDLTTV